MIEDFGIASAGRELLEEAAKKQQSSSDAPVGDVYKESFWDRSIVSSAATVDKDVLAGYLRLAELGDTSRLYAWMDEMRARDSHLDSELKKATNNLTGSIQDVLAFPSDARERGAEKKAQFRRPLEIAAYVRAQVFSPDVRTDLAIASLADGLWKGIGGFQVKVAATQEDGSPWPDGRERVREFKPIPSQRFRQDPESQKIVLQQTGDWDSAVPIEDLGASVVVLVADPGVPSLVRKGLLRRLVGLWLIKNRGIVTWAQFVEQFGQPIKIGFFDRDEEKAQLKKLLFDLGANAAGVFRKGTEIQLVEAAQRIANATPHERIADWVDRQYSKLANGHDQSAGVRENAGSQESSKTGDEIAVRETNARGVEISAVFRAQFTRPLVARNFSVQDAIDYTPELPIRMKQQANLQILSEAFKNFASAGITTIPVSSFHDLTGIPQAEEGEERIQPPAAPPAPVPPQQKGRVLPFRGSASSELQELEADAVGNADRSGRELLEPFLRVIDQAQREGLTMSQLYTRVLQIADVPPDSPRLIDLLAAVQLEATMRGWTRERQAR